MSPEQILRRAEKAATAAENLVRVGKRLTKKALIAVLESHDDVMDMVMDIDLILGTETGQRLAEVEQRLRII